jgi:dephospho-CoA kinase
MVVAALTGNIGMGKSQALKAFSDAGVFTVDSDKVVAELLTEPSMIDNVKFILGAGTVNEDGTVNKKAVADIIFNDDDMRKAFEDIIHPMVIDRVNALIASSGETFAVVEVPLLFERSYENQFACSITVYAEESVAIDRLMEAGLEREDIVQRLMCQMPISEKITRSDFTIDNNGAPDEMLPRIKQISRALKAQAQEQA